jgi:hypothetical protein
MRDRVSQDSDASDKLSGIGDGGAHLCTEAAADLDVIPDDEPDSEMRAGSDSEPRILGRSAVTAQKNTCCSVVLQEDLARPIALKPYFFLSGISLEKCRHPYLVFVDILDDPYVL